MAEGKFTAKAVSKETLQAMQADRDAGVLIKEIARKYGVSSWYVSKYTEPAQRESVDKGKADWPEWAMWDALHRKYGRGNGNNRQTK